MRWHAIVANVVGTGIAIVDGLAQRAPCTTRSAKGPNTTRSAKAPSAPSVTASGARTARVAADGGWARRLSTACEGGDEHCKEEQEQLRGFLQHDPSSSPYRTGYR